MSVLPGKKTASMQKRSCRETSEGGVRPAAEAAPGTHAANPPDRLPLCRFAWADALVILLVAAGSALTLPAFGRLAPETVAVFRENRLIASYPLAENRTVTVDGYIGAVTIEIKDRKVEISHAGCPRGVCMKTGAIGRPHRQIVCAPNRILVTINSSAGDSLDAIVK